METPQKMRHNVYRKLKNGELILSTSYADLDEAQRIAALFNETWPGEYCVQSVPINSDGSEI